MKIKDNERSAHKGTQSRQWSAISLASFAGPFVTDI
jgi:hypothetical protein